MAISGSNIASPASHAGLRSSTSWKQRISQLLWVLFSFRGRISPTVWMISTLLVEIAWWVVVAMTVRSIAESAPPGSETASSDIALAVLPIATLVTVWISLALNLKRLHDYGRSWGSLLGVALLSLLLRFASSIFALAPIGNLILLCAIMMLAGQEGPNRYAVGPGWLNRAHPAMA